MADTEMTSVRQRGIGKPSTDGTDADGSGSYERVSLFETGNETGEERERRLLREKWVRRLDAVWTKVQGVFWVALAVLTIYWTNFFRVIWESPLILHSYLYLGLTTLFFNMSLIAFLALYCESYLGVDRPWETLYPQAIPMMMVMGIATFVLFYAAFYPVWGWFLSAGIQFVFFVGYLNAGQFLPSGVCGSILMLVIFFGAFFTSVLVPHEGLAHYKPPADDWDI